MTEKNTPLQIFPCQRVNYVVSTWRTSLDPALVLLLLLSALCWACFVPSTTLPAAMVFCYSSSEALLSFLTSPVFIVCDVSQSCPSHASLCEEAQFYNGSGEQPGLGCGHLCDTSCGAQQSVLCVEFVCGNSPVRK